MNEYFPTVVQVIPLDNFHVQVFFDDGKIVDYDATKDLNADFPAKYARINLKWKDVPMMCFHELDVPNSLEKCLRVLIVVNCGDSFVPEFAYLDGAEVLRK